MAKKESMILKAAKSELSSEQRLMFDNEYEKTRKTALVAYLLWGFLGFLGIHKFYLKKTGMGVLYLFTVGLFVIGWIIDIFTLPKQIRIANEIIAKDLIIEVKMLTKQEKSAENHEKVI